MKLAPETTLIGRKVTFERVGHGRPAPWTQTIVDVVEWQSDCGRYFRLAEFGHMGLGPNDVGVVRVESLV